MKFSVLLPTRNRLELLKYAVETVRRQDYDDWEIIISDNFSKEDVASYVQSLKEPRIKYYRTESFVPVTDNWNNALEKSSGDYVIMLGDDDCLMKGFFTTIRRVVKTYSDPDFIYTKAYLYAYPGVLPDSPQGFLRPYSFAPFFRSAKEPFWLSRNKAAQLVRQSMNFKMTYTFNMQHSIVSRRCINQLRSRGTFFQSPYPDFYAMNVLFLTAKKILVCPYPLVTVGISPKSFGFYFFNKREDKGIEFLNNLGDLKSVERLRNVILPQGSMDRTSWLVAMETIKANFRSDFRLRVNYNRYRYLQILYVYGQSKDRVAEMLKLLHWWEKLVYAPFISLAAKLSNLLPSDFRNKIVGKLLLFIIKTPVVDAPKSDEYYDNILEVFDRVEPLPHHDRQINNQ